MPLSLSGKGSDRGNISVGGGGGGVGGGRDEDAMLLRKRLKATQAKMDAIKSSPEPLVMYIPYTLILPF
jgi:hypothetical protein